jgi:hypothetical protein
MSKQAAEEEKPPPTYRWPNRHGRKDPRKTVPLKYRDHPPRRMRTLVVYLIIAVVAFMILHYVLKVG